MLVAAVVIITGFISSAPLRQPCTVQLREWKLSGLAADRACRATGRAPTIFIMPVKRIRRRSARMALPDDVTSAAAWPQAQERIPVARNSVLRKWPPAPSRPSGHQEPFFRRKYARRSRPRLDNVYQYRGGSPSTAHVARPCCRKRSNAMPAAASDSPNASLTSVLHV